MRGPRPRRPRLGGGSGLSRRIGRQFGRSYGGGLGGMIAGAVVTGIADAVVSNALDKLDDDQNPEQSVPYDQKVNVESPTARNLQEANIPRTCPGCGAAYQGMRQCAYCGGLIY